MGRVFQLMRKRFVKNSSSTMRCNCSELSVFSKEPIRFKTTVFSRYRVSSLPKLSWYIFTSDEKLLQFHSERASIFKGAKLTRFLRLVEEKEWGHQPLPSQVTTELNWENCFIKISYSPNFPKTCLKKIKSRYICAVMNFSQNLTCAVIALSNTTHKTCSLLWKYSQLLNV